MTSTEHDGAPASQDTPPPDAPQAAPAVDEAAAAPAEGAPLALAHDDGAAAATAAPATPAAPKPDLSPEATGARLAELFPALFVGPDGRGTWKPIKLRIHADIQARAPGQFSKRALGIFFSRYTTTTAYLRALAAPGAQRCDLDGQSAGEIAEEHRTLAAEEVARRQAIAAERRAAQREAHLQAQRAARQAAAEQART
jgi:ProP effector